MQKFEPRRYLEEITKSKITSLQVAPPIAAFLAKSLLLDENRYDLSSVRDAMSGGAPLAPEIVTMVYKRCGFWVKSVGLRRIWGACVCAFVCVNQMELTWKEDYLARLTGYQKRVMCPTNWERR